MLVGIQPPLKEIVIIKMLHNVLYFTVQDITQLVDCVYLYIFVVP